MFLLITVYCVYIMNAVAFNTDHHGLHISNKNFKIYNCAWLEFFLNAAKGMIFQSPPLGQVKC